MLALREMGVFSLESWSSTAHPEFSGSNRVYDCFAPQSVASPQVPFSLLAEGIWVLTLFAGKVLSFSESGPGGLEKYPLVLMVWVK